MTRLEQIIQLLIRTQAALPEIVELVLWIRALMQRAGDPVPSTRELADRIDQAARDNAAYNQSEIARMKAKLASTPDVGPDQPF